ncbi:hypothetical protein [Paenibacillus hexagrammi]|uniref:Uncharacterized protein n=1 Tax=Paenibacillus hexagrammi TaxID=2908839 RepID=A0ABY3SKA2_9BACL|nr:hypothetical protein [Paenibacillus sp. YPD9-1]UJF34292.1 hypothetical protein L0M14_03510 [Paenibacillus sp. YPD9-1]
MNDYYDLEGQRQRKQEIFYSFSQEHHRFFSWNGDYIGKDMGHAPRPADLMQCCVTYLHGRETEAVRKANAVIRRLSMGTCHFLPYYSLFLLNTVADLLDSDVKEKLIIYSNEHLDEFAGRDHDFVGVNDNYPCISSYTLMAGGLRFQRPELVEKGKLRLGQLAEMLRRRGAPSEYNSPSYTILQIHALSAIPELHVDEEMSAMAKQCEHRIWVEYLSHLYLPACRLAGPYSRSYMPTLLEHGIHPSIIYVLFGNIINHFGFNNEEMTSRFKESDHHLLAADFHLPVELAEWFLNRKYPFTVEATTEFNASTDEVIGVQKLWSDPDAGPDQQSFAEFLPEYASGTGRISTYMTEGYSLGVASREWHCGSQTDTFLGIYTPPIQGRHDVRMLFSRYSINDTLPGQTNGYPQLGTSNGPYLFWDQGRKLGLHHESTAMMLYKPRVYGRKQVTSLRLMLIMPITEGEPDELWFGEQQVSNLVGESVVLCPIFLKIGQVYTAIFPLVPTNHGRKRAIRAEKSNGFMILSFYNYEGRQRDFSKEEFLLTGSGFITEFGSEQQYGSFQLFKQAVSSHRCSDQYLTNIHMRDRTVRQTVYERGGVKLACEYSPVSEGIRYMSVNGRPIGDVALAATGLDVSKLPFI